MVSEPGHGHAESDAAQHAIKKFGVNEKDMPPTKIVRLSKEIGFSRAIVFPHPNHLLSVSYRTLDSKASKFARLLEESGIPASLRAAVLSIFLKWRNGLVVLEK